MNELSGRISRVEEQNKSGVLLYGYLSVVRSEAESAMYPGGHGQPPGPPGPGGQGGPGPGSAGDSWNPITAGLGAGGGAGGLGGMLGGGGGTMLAGGPGLGQLGMNTLGTIINTGAGAGAAPSSQASSQGAGAGMMPPANISPIGSGSLTPPGDGSQPHFLCPRRPNLGREGRPIMLRANHFQVRTALFAFIIVCETTFRHS